MIAEVVLLESKELKPGERQYAQLRLAKPGLFLPGDRFIIRQFSPVTTMGGGRILDIQPPKHRLGDPSVRECLKVLEGNDAEARLELWVEQSGEAPLGALVARTGWQPWEVLRLGKSLEERKRLMVLGQPPSLLIHGDYFHALAMRVLEALEKFHAENPLVPGLAREELRGRIDSRRAGAQATAPSAPLFNAILEALSTEGKIEARGETVRLAGRDVHLSAEEIAAKDTIGRAFEQAGLAVPSAREVLESLKIDRARAEKILQILLKEKALIKVSENLIFHRAALEKLRAMLAERKAKSNRINVAVFKEMTGLSRKYAIPLLEYLDRERVTRREGEERIIL